MPATDVSAVEVQNLPGQPRRFDVTCWYAFPSTVTVDFPRQTRPDNRDIGVNMAGDGFYRVYDFRSPYAEVTNEGRGGGRGDLQIWLTRDLRAELAAELAEASPMLARELGLMSSVRGAVEARW